MKITQISKFFEEYLSGMEWGLSMSRQGITEVPGDCPAVQDRVKVLNGWTDMQKRASCRRNKAQARMISYLWTSNHKRLAGLRDEIIRTLVSHGYADKVRSMGFTVKED